MPPPRRGTAPLDAQARGLAETLKRLRVPGTAISMKGEIAAAIAKDIRAVDGVSTET